MNRARHPRAAAKPRHWRQRLDAARATSFDGRSPFGAGQRSFADGALQGGNGKLACLVSTDSHSDIEIRAEHWADKTASSGTFSRCHDHDEVGSNKSYQVNIVDATARSDRLVLVHNGQPAVDVRDTKYRSGPLALQSAGGTIRFRKLLIRALS